MTGGFVGSNNAGGISDTLFVRASLAAAPLTAEHNDTLLITADGLQTGNVLESYKYDKTTGTWVGPLANDDDVDAIVLALSDVDGDGADDDLTVTVGEGAASVTMTLDMDPMLPSLTYTSTLGAPTAAAQDNSTVIVTSNGAATGVVQQVWRADEETGTWVNTYGGSDADWYQALTTTQPTDINQNIWTGGFVGFGGNNNPRAQAHFNNSVAPAAITAYDHYKLLTYTGGTPAGSYGIGISSGTQWYNTSTRSSSTQHRFMGGGDPIFDIRGDGYLRGYDYGDGKFDNGTPTSVLMPDASGWFRERPVSAGQRPVQAKYGGNWLYGGWSPVYTANTGYVDRGWATAFTATAPTLPAWHNAGRTFDCEINGNFGQLLYYNRECIVRLFFGWRVLVNGTVVGTRTNAIAKYADRRTNLGNETVNGYYYENVGSFHWVRNSIPSGATVEVQFRMRHQATAMQTNGYARFIHGVYREANFHFTPQHLIAI